MQYQIADVYETRAGISVVLSCDDEDEADKTLLFKPSLWLEEGLQAGDVLDEESMEHLSATAQFCQAIARAEGLLASTDYSRTRLIYRLMRYGFDRSVCERAADYMIEKGYIREMEQAPRIARFYCKNKHWGKKRIAAELMGRGYCHDAGREGKAETGRSPGTPGFYVCGNPACAGRDRILIRDGGIPLKAMFSRGILIYSTKAAIYTERNGSVVWHRKVKEKWGLFPWDAQKIFAIQR